MSLGTYLAETGRLPDSFIRAAIRARHRAVLRREDPGSSEARQELVRTHLRSMAAGPIAAAPQASNQQHYEVPPRFFEIMLGPWMKYSACLWSEPELGRIPGPQAAERERTELQAAEERMLALSAERAGLQDGMRVLDLGCGWGSFTLWAAERFPNSCFWAVSNARDQGLHIREQAAKRGLSNVEALTADMNDFAPPAAAVPFDRIVSVEMFEHMRNWQALLARIASWLADGGHLFLHVFTHRELAYFFRSGPGHWMGELFFTGGMMPSDSLALHLQQALVLEDHWRVSGRHYARTLDAWLALLDASPEAARDCLAPGAGSVGPQRQLVRWRLFLMACSELFAFAGGDEWLVSQYLFSKRTPQ